MNLPEAIYRHSLNLPEPAAREVLDFIEFLESRLDAPTRKTAAPSPATVDFIARHAGVLGDDFPDDIDDSDLPEDLPRASLE
jgi:hypothetical protein